jgi:hypothetical protein
LNRSSSTFRYRSTKPSVLHKSRLRLDADGEEMKSPTIRDLDPAQIDWATAVKLGHSIVLDLRDWASDLDIPTADPAIQLSYQAALGAFIVEFNRLDTELTLTLRYALSQVGMFNQLPRFRVRSFGQKLEVIELLQAAKVKGLGGVPIQEIRTIAAIRNHLAHAHFDQDPLSGRYILVTPKQTKETPEWRLKEEAIRNWTTRARAAHAKLGDVEMILHLRGVPE